MKSRRGKTLFTPRPFLKWVGGKRQLLDALAPLACEAGLSGRYHEPFIGGGALFFELAGTNKLSRKEAFLSDSNGNLIETYRAVQDDVERVIRLLEAHQAAHCEEYYYAMRAAIPAEPFARAARIIYLNKTCFNGLYRENSRGEFNVPIGKYVNPTICDAITLRAAAKALAHAKVEHRPFETVLAKAQPGDFVYFDPPYHPVSRTSSFAKYEKSGFDESAQRRLAAVYAELTRRGVKAMLSNSWTGLILELYRNLAGQGVVVEEIKANRNVNSRADRRGAVSEALVRNF